MMNEWSEWYRVPDPRNGELLVACICPADPSSSTRGLPRHAFVNPRTGDLWFDDPINLDSGFDVLWRTAVPTPRA